MLKLNVVLFFFLSLSINCLAQSPVEIPDVHQEEHHKPVFENDNFRLLRVSVDHGESCNYHIHKNNITYVAMSGASLKLDSISSSKSKELTLPTGWIGRDDSHSSIPMAHRFTNTGSSNLLIFAVEFLGENSVEYQIEEELLGAKTYSIKLEQGEFFIYNENDLFIYSKSNPAGKGWLFAEQAAEAHFFKRSEEQMKVYCFRKIAE